MTELTFEKALDALDYTNTYDGEFEAWLREVWSRQKHAVSGKTSAVSQYRLLYGLAWVYANFANVLFDFNEEEDIYISPDYSVFEFPETEDEDSFKDYIREMIAEQPFSEAREYLNKFGVDRVFESLYGCLNPKVLDDSDDFDAAEDEILNNVDADKASAYSWLSEFLG